HTRVYFFAFLVQRFSRQQHLGFDAATRGSHQYKLTRQIHVKGFHVADVSQKVVGNLSYRDIVNIQLVALNKKQQQIERSFELRKVNGVSILSILRHESPNLEIVLKKRSKIGKSF